MASYQIYRIEFVANNPYGEFVAGDVLDIFVETDNIVVPAAPLSFQTAGISAQLNGSPYSGSTSILDFSPSIALWQDLNQQICIGTAKLTFNRWVSNPYIYYYSEANHFSCTVNPPTCDLSIVGVPIVVPATGQTEADGSIQVVAISSNDIQMNLGSDFVYGEGQIESVFSGLLPGSYRVYVRDSANCATNILVEVPFSNEFGTKYRLDYKDAIHRPTRIDITMRGYSGSINEICMGGTPIELSLRGEGVTDKFEPMMSTQANVQLISNTDRKFLELYTTDPNLYRVEYSKDFGAMTPGEPGFTPASLPTLDNWTNVDTGGVAWNTGAQPYIDFNGLGLNNTSDILYTDYAFEEGRTYTFDYSLNNPSTCVTYKIKIFDGSMNELMTTDILIGLINTSGTYTVTAPSGAAGIGLVIFSGCSCGASVGTPDFCRKTVLSFVNTTPAISGSPSQPVGYELLWLGKVLPMLYEEEYKAPPYYVNVTATDGLAELKNSYLIQDDGQKFYGTIKLIKLIAYCLAPLKLDLDIRVACNLYAEGMNQENANDPLDQAYCDFEAFYLAEKEPTLEFVLRTILDTFGARITQWGNRWNIVRVEEMRDAYDWRQFDHEGEYISYGTYNPVIDIEYPDDATGEDEVLLANADHNLEIRPGYGQIKTIYHLGLKPNVLSNGDFRLKSTFIPAGNIYSVALNTDGWSLVNAGYPITNDTYEFVDENNIAWVLTSPVLQSTGEAYIQSDTYTVMMGTNNQLKISIRYKISSTIVRFGTLVFRVDVPYTKVRVRVKYGSLYLQADGTWSSTESILVFHEEKTDEYVEREIIAQQPTSGTPISGMSFDIRVYQAYPYHADFNTVSGLRAFDTYDGSDEVIPTGYITELKIAESFGHRMYYYKLEENTASESLYSVIRPDDYHATNNPRQWVLYDQSTTNDVNITNPNVNVSFAIDRVRVSYLTDGRDPIDAIVRSVKGETNNTLIYEKHLYLGSYSTLVVTEPRWGIDLGIFFPKGGLSLVTTNVLSAELVYAGWLRDENGNGYELWARDGVAESDKLHGIVLKSYAEQYKKSWRLLRGSILAHRFFGMLDVAREVNDNNRRYLPIGLTFDDKRCIYTGEFLELVGGSDDDEEPVPFTSGFTIGFGSGSFN